MANKLEEMKRKLLQGRVSKAQPILELLQTPKKQQKAQIKQPVSVNQDVAFLSAERIVEENKDNQKEGVVQSEKVEIYALPQPPSLENGFSSINKSEKIEIEQEEIKENNQSIAVITNNLPIIPAIEQDKEKEKPEIIAENNYSVQLMRQAHFSCSIDQEIKNITHQKDKTEQHQSKVEKKQKKIVLKQLLKVKQCIQNLQSSIKGLQYIQSKTTNYPSLKMRLKKYVDRLKDLNQ